MTDQPLIRKQNLNAFTDLNIKGQNIKILLSYGRKHCGKKRKCWLATFSFFPQCFQQGFPHWHQKSLLYSKRFRYLHFPNCLAVWKTTLQKEIWAVFLLADSKIF